jgi:hypothetical protein
MKNPKLIGLSGLARSGKDTAADKISVWCKKQGLTVARHGFADKLKESAAHALGVFEDEIDFCNKLKGDYERGTVQVRMASVATGPNFLLKQITGREFLQYYGTEAHRNVFGSDFWVDALLPATEGNYGTRFEEENIFEDSGSSAGSKNLPDWWKYFRIGASSVADVCLITDCRFDNEAERIVQIGGEIWRVDRDGSGAGEAGAVEHASEQNLPGELISLIIDNNGSLSDLSETVDSAMERVMGVTA